jgi:hypothetical protein
VCVCACVRACVLRLLQRLKLASQTSRRDRRPPRVLLATATVAAPVQFASKLLGCNIGSVELVSTDGPALAQRQLGNNHATGSARTVRPVPRPHNGSYVDAICSQLAPCPALLRRVVVALPKQHMQTLKIVREMMKDHVLGLQTRALVFCGSKMDAHTLVNPLGDELSARSVRVRLCSILLLFVLLLSLWV